MKDAIWFMLKAKKEKVRNINKSEIETPVYETPSTVNP